jgi:L-aspartate oxidase
MAELAPRDVVSRAIFQELQKSETTHVFLDISHKEPEYVKNRFPNIYKTCLSYGIDITTDRIPVAPAEHYCMGGIRTDAWGRTGIEGFYACGEAACNGIHGANRLASNSLLEGLVFGKRIAQEVSRNVFEKEAKAVTQPQTLMVQQTIGEPLMNTAALKTQIRKLMTKHVGIIRNEEKLQKALSGILEIWEQIRGKEYSGIEQWELVNMVTLSEMVIRSALLRTESRGAHYRTDYPQTDDIHWKKNNVL